MNDVRRVAGALCIVVAMVLGAFGGLSFAQSRLVSDSSTTGTRGDDRHLMSAYDLAQKSQSNKEAEAMAAAHDTPTSQTLAGGASPEVVGTNGVAAAKAVTPEDQKQAMNHVTDHTVKAKDGSIRVQPGIGTRGFPPGTIEAGGPYVATEGDVVTFTVTSNDPTIIFFQYDFNNDGVSDFPDQTGAGTLGRWTTLTSISWRFLHPYFGDVLVRGWDGVSTITQFNTGDNLGENSSPYWYVFPANSGHQFTPKSNLRVTELGTYQWFNQGGYGYEIRIWDKTTMTTIAQCTPDDFTFEWTWCTLGSPITVLVGHDYIIAEHHVVDYYPYFMGLNLDVFPIDTPKITVGDFFYTWSDPYAFPATDGGSSVTMMVDFKWQETLVFPDVATATASLFIQNVSPIVGDVTSSPNPGVEGSPTSFLASFSDPGLNETWQYRWKFFYPPIGWTTGPWTDVSKYDGGAKVLFLHTYAGDGTTLMNNVKNICGVFCVTIDQVDFGPTGVNTVPSLATLLKYDVIVVGTNYFNTHMVEVGDKLADYMDAAGSTGGGVILTQGAIDDAFGCLAGVCGRFDDDMYGATPRGFIYGSSGSMGSIYVPGHPLLNGVSSVSTNGLAGTIFTTNPGATRIVDWDDGRVLGAVNTNPMVSNGARSVALNMFPILGFTGGDYVRMIVNAIKWASRQADPVIKPMPITLDPYTYTFADDVPTTTPQDDYPVSVEVRDDSDGTVAVTDSSQLYFQDFNVPSECDGAYYFTSTFPPGWDSFPNPFGWVCDSSFGSRGPNIWYYYNDPLYGTGDGVSDLVTPSFDLSGFLALRYTAYHNWQGDYPSGSSTGIIDASTDGGSSFPIEIHRFEHNNPGSFQGYVSFDVFALGGEPDVRIRYQYLSNDDWWWYFDNVQITGINGFVWQGLGSADGSVSIANVPPTVAGGFDTVTRDESQGVLFKGFRLTDPALIQPTEWFAYRFNFDDGTPTEWVYKGSLAPPRFSVLIVNTICLGPIDVTCGDQQALVDTLLSLDDVASVDTFNFINYPFLPTAPDLDTMLQYDVIIVATNWAYFSYAPFDLARRQVGDRLADYVDSGRGGVLTMMCVYCLSGGNDLFSIRGRYMNDQYGPFKRANYLFPGASAIDILEPDHDAFVNVGTEVGSMFIHDGKLPLTIGGNNAAAGTDGQLLANWDDGTTAVGVKELNTGARTTHFGGFAHPTGADTPMLLRNLIGWSNGGLPSPKVPEFTHTWGDNGIYNVDIEAIDDDMGWVWDEAANEPLQVLPDTSMGHRFVTVAVNNVDPTIDRSSIQAFIATEVCVRVAGTEGNTVTLNVFRDGALLSSVSATRRSGDPNPTTEKCGLFKIDVLGPSATYTASLTYDAPMGGSNPSWAIFMPWRAPVSPGHGTVTIPLDTSGAGTEPVDVGNLKQALLDSGRGARIDFAAEASDPGTDDLAFVWSWGGEANIVYDAGSPRSDYTINVHHNDGAPTSSGIVGPLAFLGFDEPFFDRAANTERSPLGSMDLTVFDSANHAFAGGQSTYIVFLMVVDDDTGRGYASHFAPEDGIDIQVVIVNLG